MIRPWAWMPTGERPVGERPDGLECLGVVPHGPLEGSFVEAGDEVRERVGRVIADRVAEHGSCDALDLHLYRGRGGT
jgi:hypothetical protein